MAEADLRRGIPTPVPVDLTDDCTRLLGQICAAGNPIDPRVIRALTFLIDSVNVTGSSVDIIDRVGRLLGIVNSITNPVDISDRAARLVGIVYGNLTQLQQRAITNELLVQLATAGVQYDARDRNWDLNFATDQVDASGSVVTTASGSLSTMEDAFMELRLMADNLKDLPLTIEPSTSRIRINMETVGGLDSKQSLLDNIVDIDWATSVRPQII